MPVLSVHDVEPSLPRLAGARALMGPHTAPQAAAAAAAAAATVTSLPPLQPRSATTGGTDLLFPLQVPCVCEPQNFTMNFTWFLPFLFLVWMWYLWWTEIPCFVYSSLSFISTYLHMSYQPYIYISPQYTYLQVSTVLMHLIIRNS
jgi:hypothetical protein